MLPPPEKILPQLSEEPRQESPEFEEFDFDYQGANYSVRPRADFQLRGLVVSHNKVGSWFDAYHDSSSVDFRDICVIWGEALENDAYQRLTYWSEPWSCHIQSDSREDWLAFDIASLSNSHLLTDNPRVQAEVIKARIGDQILLEGMLVDYKDRGSGGPWRKTSLTREDTGNGACEIIFLENFQILETANTEFRKLEDIANLGFNLCFALGILLFLYSAYKPMLK